MSLDDLDELVRDETVSVTVNRDRGFFVRRVDEAEDLPGLLVEPVVQATASVVRPGM